MDLSSAAVMAQRMGDVPSAFAVGALRKVLDIQSQEAAQLVQLIDPSGSTGTVLNLIA